MVGLEPVVRVEKSDALAIAGNRQERPDGARGIAVVRVIAVEPDVPDAFAVDPILRKTVRNEDMFRRHGLLANALDAALQQPFLFLEVRRNDRVARALTHFDGPSPANF